MFWLRSFVVVVVVVVLFCFAFCIVFDCCVNDFYGLLHLRFSLLSLVFCW